MGDKRGYAFGHINLKVPEKFVPEYAMKVQDTMDPFAGKFIVKTSMIADKLPPGFDQAAANHGETHTLSFALEFPSEEKAKGWFDSEAYQKLIPVRDETSDFHMMICGGHNVALAGDSESKGYVFGHVNLKVPEKFVPEYAMKVDATIAPHGGQFICKASNIASKLPPGFEQAVTVKGDTHTLSFMIEFPDEAKAKAWYDSAEYQALVPVRNETSDFHMIVTKGHAH